MSARWRADPDRRTREPARPVRNRRCAGSMSTSTGRSPAFTTAAGTEKQVYAGMATERPGRNDFNACSSSVRAALPLDKRNVCRTLRYAASSVSIAMADEPPRRGGTERGHQSARHPRERPSAGACVPASRDVPHNRRSDQSCEADRQTLPDVDRHPVLGIRRIDLRQLTAAREPVMPVERQRPGAPLLL